MKKSHFILQIVISGIIIVILSLVLNRSLELVLSYKSLILIFLFCLIPTIFIYGIRQTRLYIMTAFIPESSQSEKRGAIAYFKTMMVYIISSSLAISIAVICFYLGNLDNTLGRFLELALITPLYALFISLTIFMPLKISIERDLTRS